MAGGIVLGSVTVSANFLLHISVAIKAIAFLNLTCAIYAKTLLLKYF